MLNNELKTRIQGLIDSSEIVLFMKGDKYIPQCGFSAAVVKILNKLEQEYTTFDILEDPELRSGLKVYAKWPTYPQLYHKGELLGGCDIVHEMYENGELKELLNSK